MRKVHTFSVLHLQSYTYAIDNSLKINLDFWRDNIISSLHIHINATGIIFIFNYNIQSIQTQAIWDVRIFKLFHRVDNLSDFWPFQFVPIIAYTSAITCMLLLYVAILFTQPTEHDLIIRLVTAYLLYVN